MKTKIFFTALLLPMILCSCLGDSEISKAKDGDVLIMNKDTFDVFIDTHFIVSREKLRPQNVLKEASPDYKYTTNKGFTCTSVGNYHIGQRQIYKTLVRRKNHELPPGDN